MTAICQAGFLLCCRCTLASLQPAGMDNVAKLHATEGKACRYLRFVGEHSQ
ncbi:hypothetical protein PR003_g18491 [Phytophthora rubi]|uniref:Uncharacterized protein n=1 Tax=Phytophthora rubi TaxID=129364 RepID=A0A6A3K982_9STRA|nr:hypothetical protein PR002_g18119 [Phytophthora rubi]KAE9002319.1 hypothetical protein PR001_g18285 [Phytophthora rubi]KAE9317365.1 hypothetical protein PR003_g18491 [Phytophthora rubi]